MAKKVDDTEAVEESAPEVESKTEEQDHEDNGAEAVAPEQVEPRRDGNGALLVN